MSEGIVLEVTYELSPEDFWRFAVYYRRHKMSLRPLFRNAFAGILLLVFVGGLWVVLDSWLRIGRIQWSMMFSLAGIAWFFRRFLLPTRKRVARLAMQQPGLLCEHAIAISPLWFFEKTAVNETKVAWKTLQSIEEDADYHFFFIGKANAFIIPKRAFSSLAEAQAFLDKARQYWEAAKAGQTASSDDTGTWPPPPQSVKQG